MHFIEIPHSENRVECLHAIQVFLDSGSHFLSNLQRGYDDGKHKAWLMVDMDNKEEVRQIIPPLYRDQAKITKLTRYTKDKMVDSLKIQKT